MDKLEADNRAIEKYKVVVLTFPVLICLSRYVRDKRGRRLQDCMQRSEDLERDITEFGEEVEDKRRIVADLNREIASGGSIVANLRDNLRVRRLQADIDATQTEIGHYDLEGAAQARQNFENQYANLKKKEDGLHGEVC